MENRTEIVEFPELIAIRVPPGDKWMLKDDPYENVYPSSGNSSEYLVMDNLPKGSYSF